MITNKEEALAVVMNNAAALRHVSPELKNDREVVRVAVEASPLAIMHASPS
jgi:hypothetical protein